VSCCIVGLFGGQSIPIHSTARLVRWFSESFDGCHVLASPASVVKRHSLPWERWDKNSLVRWFSESFDGCHVLASPASVVKRHSLPWERWDKNRPPKGKGGQGSEV
jgi:hypothetical protein